MRNWGVSGSEPRDSAASDPELALAEWLATRDPAQFTHRVCTAYGWDRAAELVRQGWAVDAASWQSSRVAVANDTGGWVILLSRKIR